jgi:Na+-transporting NADH:ubiquinone oxidoreductase subunit NqrB
MLVVFLGYFPGIHVILNNYRQYVYIAARKQTYLNNLFIRHTSEENILFILVWMESNDVRYLPVAEALEALAGFRVPELHLAIVPTGEKLSTIIRKRHIFHIFCVPMEGTQTVAMRINVPKLKIG